MTRGVFSRRTHAGTDHGSPDPPQGKLGLTYIFITHDLTSITYFCSRVVFLKDGSVVANSPVSELSKLDVPYAKELLGAVLDFNAESA